MTTDSASPAIRQEIAVQNRNLGEIFSWWDRMFGTYEPGGTDGLRVRLRATKMRAVWNS